MSKRIISVFLCVSMSFACVAQRPTYKVQATEYEGREDEYFELCKSEDLSKEDIQVCRGFKDYIASKQESLDQQIAANKEKINDLNLELDEVYTLIADVGKKIKIQEDKIEVLDAEISRLEESIDQKDKRIRERMYILESCIKSNIYLEFLLCS